MRASSTRRRFLRNSLRASAATLLGLGGGRLLIPDTLAAATIPAGFKPVTGGTLLGVAPFVGEGNFPLETLIGSGLGGRLVLDLSKLSQGTLITVNDKFFIRTRYPDRLRQRGPWKILVDGLVGQPMELLLNDLLRDEVPQGAQLLECSGNGPNGRFGLISTARWEGIPIAKVLGRVKVSPRATRIIVSGFDEHSKTYPGSVAGASWAFSFEQLEKASAFLATAMNGLPLPKDHGYPVRLVMPGWYGNTCIKWVNRIVLVGDNAPATGHMKEYASRTHQRAMHKLAKDFEPANMDLAAMPVRVEQWRVGGKVVYRVIGILWGGEKQTNELAIRFNPGMNYVPVQDYDHQTNATWTIWSHLWNPKEPGHYQIRLKVNDPAIPTRRLDNGHYVRTVEIKET